jgi:predicted RNA polymerase sigma factor
VTAADTHRAIGAVWRMESPRLIAGLARLVRDVGLAEDLASLASSPIVELNRAVAVGMAEGPAAGLAIADAIVATGSLDRYHLLPSVRADFLVKLGRVDEARQELERAASLTQNVRERALLVDRARNV